ncbi:MAG: hypothetical protein PVG22_00750 [Chromatiales bacterium]|jgi:hypothetical protein
MKTNLTQSLILFGAACMALVFVKLMYDMSTNMAKMTGYVGTLSQDVSAMRVSIERMTDEMETMGQSIQRMDANIHSMGNAVKQGGKMFQQWNPKEIMR